MMWVFLFCLGLAVGSFLNVVVFRINTGETLRGRSRCLACLKKLDWSDLVPLFSFAIIRGRCRSCGSQVSIQYPIVEFLSGGVFVAAGRAFDPQTDIIAFAATAVFFCTLLAISVYDIRHKIIPDQFAATLLVAALIFEFQTLAPEFSFGALVNDFYAALGAFGFFAIVWLVSRGTWMGFGDAKIAFSIGLFLGYPDVVFALLASFWLGALLGIGLLVSKKASRRTEIPFAPFLAAGTFLIFLAASGDSIPWYYTFMALS